MAVNVNGKPFAARMDGSGKSPWNWRARRQAFEQHLRSPLSVSPLYAVPGRTASAAVTMNRSIRGLRPRNRDATMASVLGKKTNDQRPDGRRERRDALRPSGSDLGRDSLSLARPVILLLLLFLFEIISRRYRVFR